jgi:putative ABC transport system substrate-binding protein
MTSRGIILVLALVFALPAAPHVAQAQQTGKVYRIGTIQPGSTPGPGRPFFVQRLAELGWIEGQNVVFENRFAEGKLERLPALVGDLLRLNVDVIMANDTPTAKAAKEATRTVPIVISVGDPVRAGLIASLARPGGNLTGVDITLDVRTKSLQLLREVVPKALDIGFFVVPDNPAQVRSWQDLQGAAPSLGVKMRRFDIRELRDIDTAFALMARERLGGLVVPSDQTFLVPHRQKVVDLAAKIRIPTVYPWRSFVEVGGLMSHGNDQRHLSRMVATYVDRILRGTKPGDLPVEQPTKFELVINLKTAKALGLTIPPSLLVRADQVIE